MKVIKKDGRIQEFNKEKIYTSIYNASKNSSSGILNESDAKIIIEDIDKKLKSIRKDDELTSIYEIIGVIVSILKEDGFTELLKTYLGY